jgi:hypothetical protein
VEWWSGGVVEWWRPLRTSTSPIGEPALSISDRKAGRISDRRTEMRSGETGGSIQNGRWIDYHHDTRSE